MSDIRKYLETDGSDEVSVFACFEEIGDRGDIAMFKKDGLRPDNQYTVVIISGKQTFKTIRMDCPTLEIAMRAAGNQYLNSISDSEAD